MIHGGYYIKARCIQNSDIATAPPYIREIWDWLLKEVNHSDTDKIKRGQTLRTFHDIIDGLKWFIGYRKMTYNKGQCENAMRWLRNRGMITTMKTTRGLFITICNYDLYQDSKNYESNTEEGMKDTIKQQHSDTINKNDKNVKKERRKNMVFIPPTLQEVKTYFLENGFSEQAAIKAFNFYDVADWHDSAGRKVKNWKQKMQGVWFKDENRMIENKKSDMPVMFR
jgi:hypothetical protein